VYELCLNQHKVWCSVKISLVFGECVIDHLLFHPLKDLMRYM
jgi:hypothetical protein